MQKISWPLTNRVLHMVLIVAVVEAWYSITNLLKRYCLTFINRIDNNKVVKTGEMGGV